MKSESTVAGSSESDTRALIVAVLGMSLNVHDYRPSVKAIDAVSVVTDLFVLELDQVSVVLDDLVALVLAGLEELG